MSPDNPPATIGERVRQVRLQRGISQEQLARLADMSLVTVTRTEHGTASPRAQTIQRLATALDVSQQWLMLGDDTLEGTR